MKKLLRLLVSLLLCLSLCVMGVVNTAEVDAASSTTVKVTLDKALEIRASKLIKSLTKSKKKATQLKAVWNFMKSKKNMKYKIKYPDLSTNNWAKDYANYALANHKGNCYGFACMFAACAAQIGYNPYVVTGRVRGSRDRRKGVAKDGYTRHACVKINGKFYDPEAAWSGFIKNCYGKKKFPKKFISRKSYNFKKQKGTKKVSITVDKSQLKTTVTTSGDNYIGQDGLGNDLEGFYVISKKAYYFKDGKMSKTDFNTLKNLCAEGKSYKALADFVGKANSSKTYSGSCYGDGDDKVYSYDHVEVSVFVPSDGSAETIESVDAK